VLGYFSGEVRLDLPQGARAYLDAIAEHTGVPVSYAGVGPGASSTCVWRSEHDNARKRAEAGAREARSYDPSLRDAGDGDHLHR